MPRFPRRRIRECLERCRVAPTSQERGRALEDLICLLLTCVPGVVPPVRNAVDFADGGEIDVFVANNPHRSGFWFLPLALLAESKNWRQRVGAEEMRVFIDRIRERACEAGIMFAANGVSGDEDELNAARRHIARALEDGIHILVVTLDELAEIQTTRQFVALVLDKWMRLKAFLTSI